MCRTKTRVPCLLQASMMSMGFKIQACCGALPQVLLFFDSSLLSSYVLHELVVYVSMAHAALLDLGCARSPACGSGCELKPGAGTCCHLPGRNELRCKPSTRHAVQFRRCR